MTDPRFTTVFDGVDDLLSVVDVDEVGDIETLLMFLFDRPVGVEEAWDDEGVATGLDVLVRGNAEDIGSVYEFPMSILELARACAQTADELGPFAQNGTAPERYRAPLGWVRRTHHASAAQPERVRAGRPAARRLSLTIDPWVLVIQRSGQVWMIRSTKTALRFRMSPGRQWCSW